MRGEEHPWVSTPPVKFPRFCHPLNRRLNPFMPLHRDTHKPPDTLDHFIPRDVGDETWRRDTRVTPPWHGTRRGRADVLFWYWRGYLVTHFIRTTLNHGSTYVCIVCVSFLKEWSGSIITLYPGRRLFAPPVNHSASSLHLLPRSWGYISPLWRLCCSKGSSLFPDDVFHLPTTWVLAREEYQDTYKTTLTSHSLKASYFITFLG